jgi:hypothetical protein
MGDVIKTSYSRPGCEDPKCKPIEFEIDIESVSVHKDPEHTNKIELTDTVGIIMKYPDVDMMAGVGSVTELKTKDAFNMIIKCIDKIYDEEEISNQKDHTPNELLAWVESLTQEQFAKIEKFFNTIPKMYKDIKFNCEKCGYKEDIRIEGLASFFG